MLTVNLICPTYYITPIIAPSLLTRKIADEYEEVAGWYLSFTN